MLQRVHGYTVVEFESLTSTQDMAKNIRRANTVIVAKEQKNGRGRRGRTWESPFGGLWFTVILDNSCELVTLAAGVAVVKALERMGVQAGIKWPNDIIYGEKKLGGIIAESSGGLVYLGIGINLNNDIPESIRDIAVSVKDKNIVLEELLACILKELDSLVTGDSDRKFEILKQWKKYQIVFGRKVCVIDGELICGVVRDINSDGSLMVEVKGGELKKFYAGDVHIIQMGD